ncbi:transmembrane protein 234 homolog isoform X1 [Lycorma delicatula]|uniref:transmembrane protein 234 homolog isoform X1 n=1 Tax=Lycorma delicatula TaxID=130591 RepID=UPI003F517D13
MDLGLIAVLILIAFLWGGTNPFIKKGSQGIERIGEKEQNIIKKLVKELEFLFLNWKYVLPFGLNQCGSVLFFFVLQNYDLDTRQWILVYFGVGVQLTTHLDLNIIVPVTNSLSYAFTSLVGCLIGESTPNKRTILGLLLITVGTTCFILSKPQVIDCNNNCVG